MLDRLDPDAAYVIPETDFEFHHNPGGRLAVYRTRDRTGTWEHMTDGLADPAWEATVLRKASTSDDQRLYFGTESGSLFALTDAELWVEAMRPLPPILSVEVTAWST